MQSKLTIFGTAAFVALGIGVANPRQTRLPRAARELSKVPKDKARPVGITTR